ncbi:hypothetical protein APUTEX25_001223, partial [Auxenochlorella protothecoides]
ACLDSGPRTDKGFTAVQGLQRTHSRLGALGRGLRAISTAEKAGNAIRNAAASTGAAAKGMAGALAKVPSTAYSLLPAQARLLAEATSKPGVVQRVISLQLNSFWQQHGNKVYAVGGIFLAYCLWRTMYGVASTFINLSETMAAGGFLALSVSLVILGALYLRRKYTIDPNTVYRLAMVRLNTHPGLLEVMGAPLVGSPVRATVLTGGKLRFKGLVPRIQSRRAQIIFPLRGSERKGLASLEAKKRKGKYVFKLIAVDVPTLSGPDQRLFIEGGPAIYQRGGILDELRDPFIKAIAAEDAFVREDEADDAAEAAEEAHAAANKAATGPQPLEAGGGMYFWERVALTWQRGLQRLRGTPVPPASHKSA